VFRLVAVLAADGVDVAVACRILKVSRSGYYEWRNRPPSERDVEECLSGRPGSGPSTTTPVAARAPPRVHAELRLGLGVRVGRKRVARLLRLTGAGIGGNTHRKRRKQPAPAPHEDAARSWMCSPGPWWAGRSPTISAPNWSSTPCRWTPGDAKPRPARSSTPTGDRNTRHGSSATACAQPACSAPWAAWRPQSTTR
jgi:hypothetical protein